jgi:hypothetical protein
MAKSETNPNPQIPMTQTRKAPGSGLLLWGFGFVSDFAIRISDFSSEDFPALAAARAGP